MQENNIIFKGYLVKDADSIPVEITKASNYSLYVKFFDNYEYSIKDKTEFNKLVITDADKNYEFSSCRFILETNLNGFTGKLIFLNDIYDFNSFFINKIFLNSETSANNLGLILFQKDNVKKSFKLYIADLSFDLKVYKHFFDDLDKKYQQEPDDIKEYIFQIIFNTKGKEFIAFFEGKLKELENLIKDYTLNDHKLHGLYLRNLLWDIILCSEFMARTNIKPRGYAGDSEMMRMIYENKFCGSSTFSKILYKISLEHPGAVAVRNRRLMIPKIIRNIHEEFSISNSNMFKFMSVACGPAYELVDIFQNSGDIDHFHCTLLDQDSNALSEANENIRQIEKKFGRKIRVSYLQDSVRTLLRTPEIDKKWGQFNLIYSMGLFDYLIPPVAKAVIEKIYQLLEPGGQMLIGNYHIQNPSKWFMEYWHDWSLYYRNEDDFIALLSDTNAINISITLDDSKSQMFLLAKKPS